MLLKSVIFLVLIQIIAIWGYPEKFMIKNKKTGKVLDGANQNVQMGYWQNKTSQLWTLENSKSHGHYVVLNIENQKALDVAVATRAILTWNKHGGPNQRWKLNPDENTLIQVKHFPNEFLVHKDNVVLQKCTEYDGSDTWLLVEP